MGQPTTSERIFDFETSSNASYEEVDAGPIRIVNEKPAPGPRPPAGPIVIREGKKDGEDEDEEVPDILYVLQFLGLHNRILETRQSSSPFEKIPEYLGEKEEANGTDASPRKKPVLEIVTKATTAWGARNRRRRRGGHYPDQVNVYNEPSYFSDGYSTDDDRIVPQRIVRIQRTLMLIHSQHLINALQAVVAYYPYVNLTGKTVTIEAPYCVLVHHRDALEKYKTNQPSCHSEEDAQTTREHIDILLEFLENAMGERIRTEEARYKYATPMVTFENFWMLLKPGEVMFAKREDLMQPFIISSITRPPAMDDLQPPAYQVNCWFLEYSNNKIYRFTASFMILPWTGEQAIQSLEVIPAAYFPENFEEQGGLTALEEQAKLGRMYWDLLQRVTYMDYDGLLVNSQNANLSLTSPSGYMTGRVICDADGYARFASMAPDASRFPPRVVQRETHPPPPKEHLPHFQPRCGCKACLRQPEREDVSLFAGFEDIDPLTATPPTSDLFYIACTSVIPAFLLGERRWGFVNLRHLKPVTTDRTAFDNLVLNDEVKTTVRALIGKYSAQSNGKISPWGNDFVKNKGEGRIFLLHGAPGVGKTCTAECVAELTHRPLLSLTSGDLSVSSYSVENNLRYFLQLGQRYGALVLLDEADVYLERRRATDIQRNGLVSVFLRALEYYRGVLFLTTNRVQTFDRAFTSRIHVALHYKNLTDDDRERIWSNNFERLDRDSGGRIHVSVATREYAYESRDLRSLNWNGREIRNALQTALALAEHDATEKGSEEVNITDKHLRAVVKMSRGFKEYLKSDRVYDGDSDDEADEAGDDESVNSW